MKNIISKLIVLLFITVFFSCSKELDYGSNFEFTINNIDNNSLILKSEKTFELELTNFFNQSNSKSFTLSYDCPNVSIISDNITLLQGADYNFTFNELSTLPLKLIASQTGEFTLTINLTDINGLQKTQKVIVKVIEDLNFSFTQLQAQPTYDDILSTSFTFNFNLQSTGSGGDSFKIKAVPSFSGIILINNGIVQPKQLINIAAGNLSVTFTPDMLGKQTLTLVVINSKNVEKEITMELNITQKDFTVTASQNFEVKQTLTKQFSFITAGTIPNWTYQVMFKSNSQAKIYSSVGVIIPLNTYVDLPINSSTFNFIYESNIVGIDPLEILVKDKNGQIVSKKLEATILSKPTMTVRANRQIIVGVAPYNILSLNTFYSFDNVKAYGKDVTITDYEFKIFNYKTKATDTYTMWQNSSLYPVTQDYYLYMQDKDVEKEKQKDYYFNQSYTARIKDSDGVWSETITGTMK